MKNYESLSGNRASYVFGKPHEIDYEKFLPEKKTVKRRN